MEHFLCDYLLKWSYYAGHIKHKNEMTSSHMICFGQRVGETSWNNIERWAMRDPEQWARLVG